MSALPSPSQESPVQEKERGLTSWRFFTTAESAWEGMLETCRKAKRTIDFEQYVFGREGKVESDFREVFLRKRKEGIRIRLLLDAVGSFYFYGSDIASDLVEAGVEITFHRGIFRPKWKRLIPLFLRDHRKLLIVDSEEAHIGGVIVQERARPWRDTNVLLRGPVIQDFQSAFDTAWQKAKHLAPVGQVLSEKMRGAFSMAGNSFRLRDKALYRTFLKNIIAAKKYIYITTPYFSPNWEFRRALYYAKRKGVEIKILLPKKSDNLLSDLLAKYYIPKLLRHGIEIHYYTPCVLHAKTIVIDDNWASVGSCNFDWLSFWLNYELNVVSTHPSFACELREIFLDDIKESERDPECNTEPSRHASLSDS